MRNPKDKTFLQVIWDQQTSYNAKVRKWQARTSGEWMETYILGLISECGQLLEAMRWKRNRVQFVDEFDPNAAEELADITKYVISMWILLGHSPKDMLDKVYGKGLFLDSVFSQEFEKDLGNRIVIFDLDNVLADTQTALAAYFKAISFDMSRLQDDIHLDLALSQRFDEYRTVKNKFEIAGGYSSLEPIYPTAELFAALREEDWSIVVYTARPVETFKRIRQDTFEWFMNQGVQPDALLFGREERILYASKLRQEGKMVVLIEDDPGIIKRSHLMDIPTIVPLKEYNRKFATFNGDWEELVKVINYLAGKEEEQWNKFSVEIGE